MARVYAFAAVSAACIIGFLPQAASYPSLYDSEIGNCEIPAQAYGFHMAPTEDPAITFELTDASGAAVTEWAAGAVYTLAVGPYDTTRPTNAWIHASGGTLAPADASTHSSAAACDAAVFSAAPLTGAHTVTWTAPADDSVCVTVSTAQANGAVTGYAVSTVSLPGAKATPCDAAELDATPEEEVQGGDAEPPAEDLQGDDEEPPAEDLQGGDGDPPAEDFQGDNEEPPAEDLQGGDEEPPAEDLQGGDEEPPAEDLQGGDEDLLGTPADDDGTSGGIAFMRAAAGVVAGVAGVLAVL